VAREEVYYAAQKRLAGEVLDLFERTIERTP
jgi:hypothetical protein